MNVDTVGIVSPGEMGASLAMTLASNGLRPITTLAGRSRETRENASAAGIEDVGSYAVLIDQSDVVLSVVPSDSVNDVAYSVADGAEAAGASTLFVELNAIAPSTVESIFGELGSTVDVVDGCIIGPASDLSKATVYLSGPRARDASELGAFGLTTDVLGESIGQASGLKLCFAGMTKGTNALALDLLLSAISLDIEEPLRERYESHLEGVLEYLDYSFPGTPKRAERRAAEMEELAVMLGSQNLSGELADGSHARLSWLGSLGMDTDDAEDAMAAARRVYDAAFEPPDAEG